MKENLVIEGNKFIRYDHNKEEYKLDLGLILLRHHPILRVFSQFVLMH